MKHIWIFLFVLPVYAGPTKWTEQSILKEINSKGPKLIEACEAAEKMKLKSAVFPMANALPDIQEGTRAKVMFIINKLVDKKDVRKVIDIYERHVPLSSRHHHSLDLEANLSLQKRDPSYKDLPSLMEKALDHEYGEYVWGIIETAGELSRKDKRYYSVLRKALGQAYFERDYALGELWKLPKTDMYHFRDELIKCEKSAIEKDHRDTCKAMLTR